MTKIVSSSSIIAIALGVLLQAGAAEATTAVRTWVSGAGLDSGACTRAAPCATFQFAYNATSAGGEIDVLDGGDFGRLIIDHAITVANDGAGTAAITATTTFDAIHIVAGSTDAVLLRGLNLNGASTSGPGVDFFSGASLLIDHCEIHGFRERAISFAPQFAAQKLFVTDTVLSNNGASNFASVDLDNALDGNGTAHFERVQVLHAIGNGIRVDTTNGPGAFDVELHDVVVDGASASGIVAVSRTSGPAANIMADNVTSSHNNGFGVRAVGSTATVKLSRSTVTGNVVGIGASSGGALVSYGDNRITDNVNGDGAPTSTLALK
jgi:hypothetical protein